MVLIQLKPREEAFYKMVKNLTKKFRVIILCEGKRDTEILKALIAKAEIPLRGNIGITDCEGIPTVRHVAAFTATLARLSRRLEKIAVMVDANEHTFTQRARSVIDSLKANTIDIRETTEVSESLHKAKTEKLDILIQIAGIKNLPFKKHTLENHMVESLLLEEKIETASEAKEIINEQKENVKTTFENSEIQNVEQAFKNIVEMLRAVAS